MSIPHNLHLIDKKVTLSIQYVVCKLFNVEVTFSE